MATRETVQVSEDIIRTTSDYQFGRGRPGKINARFGQRWIYTPQHQDDFRNLDSQIANDPEFKRKIQAA